MGGVDVHVEGDGGPLAPAGGCGVARLLAREDDVPPGRELVVQGEGAGTRGLQGHLGVLAHLRGTTIRPLALALLA